MPYLTPADRDRLLGPSNLKCSRCESPVRKCYCRQCDEFYSKCEECSNPHGHEGHRTYER